MGLELGGLLGAVTQVTTAVKNSGGSGGGSLKSFLNSINQFGVQVNNNFEVNFAGLDDIMFFVQNVTIPGMELKMTELTYDGHKVEIPVNYDWNHDFTMTVINDASGYIYSAITDFFMSDASAALASSGHTLTVSALTGDSKYKGTLYTFYNVRIVNVGSLSYSYEGGDKSTFEITLKCTHFTATPGALSTTSNILGAINSLIS